MQHQAYTASGMCSIRHMQHQAYADASQHLCRDMTCRSATYMRECHGIGICRHREELVVALLVEHPAAH